MSVDHLPPASSDTPDAPAAASARTAPRTGIRSGFTRMESLDRTTPDPGYFGPDSVSWRLHHDASSVLGGIRALAFEALHPEVMLAFAEVTTSTDDSWGRLSRTGRYLNAVTFGTTAEADAASARVRRIHSSLKLDRPEWLLWVHATAVDSWLVANRRSGAPVSDEDADRYVAEQVTAARLLACDIDTVPTTVAELEAYLERVRPELECTPEAREAVRGLLFPPMPPRVQWLTPARPAWTLLAVTGVALLPRWARRMFAMPGLPTTDLQASISARGLRTALHALPESRRTNPHLAAARIRLGLTDATLTA
jgi:uncharacterized protein (DUF2236 family)